MNFYRKKRIRPAVPIITLIDILAILLIFFIVSTTFKKKESLIKINLPRSSDLSESSEAPIPRVALALDPEGQISLGEKVIPIDNLAEHLQQLRREKPGVEIELKVDSETPLKWMVKVWDGVSRAGIDIEEIPLRILLEKKGSQSRLGREP